MSENSSPRDPDPQPDFHATFRPARLTSSNDEYLGTRSTDSPLMHVLMRQNSPNSTGRRSPRLNLPSMTAERREHVLRVLRKSIPIVAAAKRRMIEESAKYAKLCIQDAFAGRLKNGLASNSKKSWWVYTLFRIQTSELLFNCVVMASVLHTFSIFLEPPNECANSTLYLLFQIAILLVYAVDIALKMTYEGVGEYLSHDWQRLYLMNLVCHILDIFFCGCTSFANPLRPVAGVLRDRRGRKFFDVLKKMVPEMLHNMVPILFFVIIVTVVCSSIYDLEVPEFQSTTYTFYNWWFLVLTNDNFSRLLPERLYLSLTYLLYFFPGIYIGQRFLLNLIIGDTYGTFRTYVKQQLDKERLKELQGLTKAFAALDEEGTGRINIAVWTSCIQHLQPDMPQESVALYFELMSGGDDHITVLQFLNLRSVLNFKLYVQQHSKNVLLGFFQRSWERAARRYSRITIGIHESVQKWAQRVMDHAADMNYFARANFLDILLLASGFSDFVVWSSPKLSFVSVTLCQLLCVWHVVEYAVRLCAAGGHLATVTVESNWISYGFAISSVLCLVYRPLLEPALVLVHVPAYYGEKALLLLRCVRCLRLANLNNDLKNFNAAIVDIFPALCETFSFTFIVTYIFGLTGHLLMGGPHGMSEWQTPLLSVIKAQELTFMVGFLDSMEAAMEHVTVSVMFYFLSFLILSLTVSNIALSIIIDLHANVLDQKTNKDRTTVRKKIDTVFEQMVDKARQRQVARMLMYGGPKQHSLNFKQIKMSEFQSSDVRKFITNHGQDGLTESELEKCNDQSNINLVDFFHEQHRMHQDLNKEADFLNLLHAEGFHEISVPPGQIIYEAGTPASKLIYLIKGTVTVVRRPNASGSPVSALQSQSRAAMHTPRSATDLPELAVTAAPTPLPAGRRHSVTNAPPVPPLFPSTFATGFDRESFKALLFLAVEVFDPAAQYHATCIAEQDTVILSLSRDELVHKLDAEMAGQILQKASLAQAKMEQTFADSRRMQHKKRRASLLTQHSGELPYSASPVPFSTASGLPTVVAQPLSAADGQGMVKAEAGATVGPSPLAAIFATFSSDDAGISPR